MSVIIDLIRHAESKWVEIANASPVPRFGGRMNEVELSEQGERQAVDFGAYAARHNIWPTAIMTSPAKRTVRTHEISAWAMEMTIEAKEEPRLQELDWGDWQGQPRSIADQWEAQRQSDGFDFAPPGGESFNMVRERALSAILEFISGLPSGQANHVWVHTHRNVIKSLVYPWMNWSAEEISEIRLDVLSITRLVYEGDRLSLAFFNHQTI